MSDRNNEIIMRVKEYLNQSETANSAHLHELENMIDDKTTQIKSITTQHLPEIIQHYLKYQEIMAKQKKLEFQCEQFQKKLQKNKQLCQYDQQMIQRSSKTLEALKKKRSQLVQLREWVQKWRNVVNNVKDNRYGNAIKGLKAGEMPKIQTPLKKCSSILKNKIVSHVSGLLNSFSRTHLPKQKNIGSLCFNKLETSLTQKTNIFRNFFGRGTFRNSLVRRSTVQEEKKVQIPLRFLKKVGESQEENLDKLVVRMNVEMNSLKQMKSMCLQLGEQNMFTQLLNGQLRKLVTDISEECTCQNQDDLRKLLSYYLGYLLFRRQIIGYFRLQSEDKLILSKIYHTISTEAKNSYMIHRQPNLIIRIKTLIDVFQRALEELSIEYKLDGYTLTIGQLLKVFTSTSLEKYQTIISEQMEQDNFVQYRTDDENQKMLFAEVLGSEISQKSEDYPFTSIIACMAEIFTQYYDYMVALVKDSHVNKSQLHDSLSQVLERIIIIYGGQLILKDQPLQIVQGERNLHYGECIMKYYSMKLETEHEYLRTNVLPHEVKYQGVTVELGRRIRELMEAKIEIMMSTYEMEYIWLPNDVNPSHHEFVEWLMIYVRETVDRMREHNYQPHEQLLYTTLAYICKVYWDFILACDEYTLLTLYNLQKDLLFIYTFNSQHFKRYYGDVNHSLQSLQEFYSLMLVNNIQELLDNHKRTILYPSLNMNRIILALKKYNRAKSNAGGKVRDLKKRVVEDILKKLENQNKT